MAEYDADVPAGIMMTSLEAVVGWLRKTSFLSLIHISEPTRPY